MGAQRCMIESTHFKKKTCRVVRRTHASDFNILPSSTLTDGVYPVTAQYTAVHFVWLDRVVPSNIQRDQVHVRYSTVESSP